MSVVEITVAENVRVYSTYRFDTAGLAEEERAALEELEAVGDIDNTSSEEFRTLVSMVDRAPYAVYTDRGDVADEPQTNFMFDESYEDED